MNKNLVLMTFLLLISSSVLVAGDRLDRQKVSKEQLSVAIDPSVVDHNTPMKQPKPQVYHGAKAYGPGVFLMDSGYDYQNNGNMQRNIINYGDGTFAVARMAATDEAVSDRGSYFTYFDGSSWLLPTTKVETARTGWADTDALADGRQVVTSHTGNEVNIDAIKGFGLWIANMTGYIDGATDHIWPRVAVDGQDNIHIVSTLRAQLPGARYGTYYPVHSWSTDEGLNWTHQYIYGDPFTELDTTNGQWQGFSIDCYPVDAYGANKVATMTVTRNDAEVPDAVWVAESEDNGATWNTNKIAEWTRLPAAGADEFRPSLGVDLAYDNDGNIHVVTTNYLVRLDSAGTGGDIFHSTTAPMRHWSEATGWVDILTYQNIPGYDPNEDIFSGDAVNSAGAGNSTTLKSPSIGFDAEGNMYVTFNTPAPGDTLDDGTNLMDIYAVGSANGGASWGPPVNIIHAATGSDAPNGLEDADASLAKLVDDNLHIVYNSDPQFGNDTGTGAAPFRTNMMYLSFPKSEISLVPVSVQEPQGEIPSRFVLHQNYPNPFNPTTNIMFDLPGPAEVKLTVYDMSGKMVTTLINGRLESGTHTVTWNVAKDVASGIYFAKLESANFSSVKKMMFLK